MYTNCSQITMGLAVMLIGSSHGVSAALTEADYPFQVPGPDDLRSPCPALNSMANHGILPRDGRDIDLKTLGTAALLGFNMTYETMLVVGIPGLTTSTTGNASTFHLSDLAQHLPRAVEHDGSLSREDAYFGDARSFSPQAWNRTLGSWGDIEIIDFAVAAKELKARFEYGKKHNPEFNATFARTGALLQYGLLMSSFPLESPIYGQANKTMVRFWIENERLPFHWGWQPPTTELTLPSNLLLAGNISALWI